MSETTAPEGETDATASTEAASIDEAFAAAEASLSDSSASNETPEGDSTEVEASTESGQAEAEGTPTETPEPEALNLDEYGDRLVTISVGGEEQTVPLREAIADGMRQADYTRKTQTLAEQQQELSEARTILNALTENPEVALQVLAQRYGQGEAPPEQNQPGTQSAQPAAEEAIPAWAQPLLERNAADQVDQVFARLGETYGELFDEQELIDAAVARGINHPGELEMVFRDLAFDKVFAQQKAATDVAADEKADNDARAAAAAAANETVTQGAGVPASAVGAPPATFDSFDDAWNAAVAEHGDLGLGDDEW